MFGRKSFHQSLNMPQSLDMNVVNGCLLRDFHIFSFKYVSFFFPAAMFEGLTCSFEMTTLPAKFPMTVN